MIRDMNEAIAFDTHRFVKRLTDSGFTERQAETLADEQVALLNANLATKADIAAANAGIEAARAGVEAARADIEAARADIAKLEVRIAKIEAGMEALRQETRASIEAVKADLLKWLFGALIAQGGLVVALVKLL